jgi:HSP20 family molecular chaperone IbpA
MKKILSNRTLIAVLFFLFGLGVYGIGSKLLRHPSETGAAVTTNENFYDKFFNDDFFDKSTDPFQEMERMQKEFLGNSFKPKTENNLFSNWYKKKFGTGEPGDIKRTEDNKYVYYEIAAPGIDPKNLDVKIENNMVEVAGKVETKSEQNNEQSYYSSNFERFFPVPPNTDANKAEIENKDKKIILKFPKMTV